MWRATASTAGETLLVQTVRGAPQGSMAMPSVPRTAEVGIMGEYPYFGGISYGIANVWRMKALFLNVLWQLSHDTPTM